MTITAEKLDFLHRADRGCPKSQFIMAMSYNKGMGVPKDRSKAKHYFKLTMSHDPEELTFIGECLSLLFLKIAYMEYVDRNNEEAVKYFELARSYIKNNYPREEAEAMILDSKMDKYMSVIDL